MVDRDPHTNHIDAYVASAREGKFIATFEHCGRNMVEIPMIMLASLPPHASAQGIEAKLVCPNPLCSLALRVTIMPENGHAKAA